MRLDCGVNYIVVYQRVIHIKIIVSQNKLRLTQYHVLPFLPPDFMFLIYSFGVIPVTFLNDLKNDARELNPQCSDNASRVYFELLLSAKDVNSLPTC